MSRFQNELEKEHVLSQLVSLNRYQDMANFFIMEDDVNSEDIFEFSFLARNKRFYVDMFGVVYTFLIKQLDKGNFQKYAGSIFTKMLIEEYYPLDRLRVNDYSNRDKLMSVFIKDIMLKLSRSGHNAELLFMVNILIDNDNVPPDTLKTILVTNIEFNTSFILEDLVYSNSLPLLDLLDIVENRFEFTTNEDIYEVFKILYTTEETLIEILSIAYSQYEYRECKSGRIKVVSKLRGKKKRFYDTIRLFLTELFISEMEIDMWDYIEKSCSSYANERDVYFLSLYSSIKDFLISNERKCTMVSNFNSSGIEEPRDMFTEQQLIDLNLEVELMRYTFELEYLSTFKFFIRLMNINRFGFLSHNRAEFDIKTMIKNRCMDIGVGSIHLALSNRVYNFLLNY